MTFWVKLLGALLSSGEEEEGEESPSSSEARWLVGRSTVAVQRDGVLPKEVWSFQEAWF